MATIGATEARANFAKLLRRASVDKEAIVIEHRGKARAAVVPIEDLELIEDRRKRARRSEERFESFAAAASDWFWEMDENCRFTYFSNRFTEVTGVPHEALLGKTREETGVPGVDPEEWRRHLADLAAHRSFRDFRHPRHHPERGTIHLSINGKAIFDEAGNFRGYRGTGSDITERKQAEEALRISDLQYRHIFEDSVVGTTLVAPAAGQADGRFLRVNKAFCELLGYSERQLLGMTVNDVTHPEDREPNLQARRRLVDGEIDSFQLEKRYIHKSGRIVWAKLSVTGVRDEEGRYVHGIGQHQDITDLKRTVEALKTSEAKLREILEDSPIGVAIVSHATDDNRVTGNRLFINSALVRMFGGGSEAAMVEADISDSWVDLDQLRAVEEIMKNRAELVDFEARRRRLDGTELWVSMNARPIRFDDQDCTMVWHFDITERKQAEQALRDSEEQLRLVTDALPVLIGIVDSNERMVFANNTYQEWFARPRSEIIGKTIAEIHPHGESYRLLRPYVKTALSGGRVAFENTITYGDGVARDVQALYVPRFATDGRVEGYFSLVEDVTERKAMQAQLQQSQKMEAVGQLTGGVAHDFNNLLAVITGNLELIAEDTGEEAEARHLAERALAAVDRGAALTQRLLAFSRRQALRPRVIELNGLVAGMNDLLRRTLGETIDIESVGATDLWACEADPAQVESALLNLAINARDAMPDGGKLTIETANVTLDDDYAASHAEVAPGPYVTVTVTDTGTGMSKDVAAQAFEPFFTTKDVGKGSGLGLSMVYGFAKQSGGHVSIYSEPGDGTAVRIYLAKAAAADAGASDKPRPAQVHLARGERILVVEDDPDVRMLAVAMLQSLGYEVAAAENAKAALAQLQDDPGFDLLLTDVVLPGGMSGRDLADHAQRLYPGFKVVYMSGYAENAIVHHGRLDEGVHLLQKPFRKAELARTLRAVLDAG